MSINHLQSTGRLDLPAASGRRSSMAEIIIDSYQCSGCGTCVEMCPEIFRVDSITEKAALVALNPTITDAVHQAAAFCPEKCIAVRE
jgi:ferredoxin